LIAPIGFADEGAPWVPKQHRETMQRSAHGVADTCLAVGFVRIRTQEFIPITTSTPLTGQPN
jgi:hypothetical protein